jgi:hypothetical protein
LWTGEDMDRFMQTHYPSFYRTFKSYKYLIQQIDAFLYHYGGISTSVSEPRPGVGKVHERVIELHERAHDGVGAKPFHETVYVRSRAPQSLLRTFTRDESYQYIYVHLFFVCLRYQSGSVLVRIVHRGPRKKLVWRDDSHIPKKTRWTN